MEVGIVGAGAIGTFLGVRLSAAGARVVLLGRRPPSADPRQLEAVDLAGRTFRPGPDLVLTDDPAALASAAAVIVTVKSQDTPSAAAAIAARATASAVVVSFQNGIENAARLAAAGVRAPIAPGMVTFNVINEGGARLRQATSGPLLAGTFDAPAPAAALAALAAAFAKTGQRLGLRKDIDAVLAGKLLLNLNNGLTALTGLPIAEGLRSEDGRWCASRLIREGLSVMRAAGVPIAAPDPLHLRLVAALLPLPSWLFTRLAPALIAIDPRARSSTLQDLDAGRPTEIDWLNGAIVRLAEKSAARAPLNAWIVEGVHRLERTGPPFLAPAEVRSAFETILANTRL